jgi:adenine-specific DNA-methyltransferase
MSSTFITNKKPADEQKLRGGYYTPIKLASYLVDWAIRDGTERILEPSCGDGNFIKAIIHKANQERMKSLSCVAIEIEEEEIKKAQKLVRNLDNPLNISWVFNDFFKEYSDLRTEERFDVLVGNPPFIRFQYFDEISRSIAFSHLKEANYKTTKLANIWVAFIQLGIELLRVGGRLAMVVPAELLQVNYAAELRTRLSRIFNHVVIVGFKRLVFPDIQQEVVLLLAEGKRENPGPASDIHTIEFESGEELVLYDLDNTISHVEAKHSRNGMKWTSLFLSAKAFNSLDEAQLAAGLVPLGELASVDVGIVTGRNSFFVIDPNKRTQLKVEGLTIPIIGRTSTLTSAVYTKQDFNEYKKTNKSYLLTLSGKPYDSFPPELIEYIKTGEEENIHTGYKCRIRRRWFDVPSVYVPGGFMFRQIHKYPLLVVNEAGATSTDTIHRVRFNGVSPSHLAATFFNSLTLAWSEVCGRSYGGGLLELEPREAEELPIPYNEFSEIDINKVDDLLKQSRDIEALDYVDDIVLKGTLGFDSLIIRNIRNAWFELRDRRINRRK